MSVKKIFVMLITIVGVVFIGAFILNTLLPNVTTTIIDAAEGLLFSATGISFDFNNNGSAGQSGGAHEDSYVGERSNDDINGNSSTVVEGINP